LAIWGSAIPRAALSSSIIAGGLWQRLPREMGQLVSLWLAASDALAAVGIPLQLVFLLESKR
jgi:hypothetical protein